MITELKRFGARIGLSHGTAAPAERPFDPTTDAYVDSVGETDVDVLLAEGLRPHHTILDFGCRSGRRAVEIVPKLDGGHYIGVDVSSSILDQARVRLASIQVEPSVRVTWIKQSSFVFPVANRSVDLFCAFDAFMHMEHEDTYRYLKSARRIAKPGGRLVLSCLPLDLPLAQALFFDAANQDFHQRWGRRRYVATSTEMMESIARLAGWQPLRWHHGDPRNAGVADESTRIAIGSTLVLVNPAAPLASVS